MRTSKRQTVWLVSMLGLMVVLSAYYLFTDPVDNLQTAGDYETVDTEQNGADVTGGTVDPEIILDEIGMNVDGLDAKSDEEILAEYEANETMGHDYFIVQQMARWEEFNEEHAALMEVLADPNASDEDYLSAYEAMGKLEEQYSIIEDLEEKLVANFGDVYIDGDENGNYVVTVRSEQLQRSEFVSIMDLVTEELNVKAANVKVEYRS